MTTKNITNEARITLSLLNAGLGINNKDVDSFLRDQATFGVAFLEIGHRKWWNPMRWIKGAIYQKRIGHKNIYA